MTKNGTFSGLEMEVEVEESLLEVWLLGSSHDSF